MAAGPEHQIVLSGNINDDLGRYALLLRNGNPEAWDRFLQAFTVYTAAVIDRVVEAQADAVLLQQGRARQCQAFLRIFNECSAASRRSAPQ